MAITPPPVRPVGQLYAAQRFGTVHGPAVASRATARAKAVNNLRRLKYGLQGMAGDGLMGFSFAPVLVDGLGAASTWFELTVCCCVRASMPHMHCERQNP